MVKNPSASNTNDQAATGFLAQLNTLATAITDLPEVAVKRDPLINARNKFATNCDKTVKLIKAAAEQGKFFKKLPDGYLITFRKGIRQCSLQVLRTSKLGMPRCDHIRGSCWHPKIGSSGLAR